MITKADISSHLDEFVHRMALLRDALAVEEQRQQVAELEKRIQASGFWDDQAQAQSILRQRNRRQKVIEQFDNAQQECDDITEYIEIADSDEMLQELKTKVEKLESIIGDLEFKRMFSGEADANHAIVAIHSGAGGTEAQDWVDMLLRMYLRWCDRRGLKASIIDSLPGDEAGLKSVTFTVEGDYAYGYLKAEVGIHRLVRISPFDANARRHTSFASLFVTPEVSDEIAIEIKDSDLKIDTYRAGGAGGQHVNKTDSAVRITHLPTGLVAQCQNERSQHKNKTMAMKILKSKLYERELEERQQAMDKYHAQKKEIAWGSQIRSYVLHPYRMVKDHRTKLEVGNVDAVLDGDITDFMENYLLKASSGEEINLDGTDDDAKAGDHG